MVPVLLDIGKEMSQSDTLYTASDGTRFRLIQPPFCRYCNHPLDPAENYWRCLTCHKVATELGIQYAFDQAGAAGVYNRDRTNAISRLILRNKRDPSVAPILAEVMTYVVRRRLPHIARVDVVTEVPISPAKLARKGFNHALSLAEELATALGLPLSPGLLRQVREPVKSQHESTRVERFQNLVDCIELGRDLGPIESVLLVDDTCVSGGSAHECSKVLKAGGAHRVFVMCAARAVLMYEGTEYLEVYFDA